MSNYEKLVSHFIGTKQIGHFDKEKDSIMLYNIPRKKKVLDSIVKHVRKVTNRYNLIVLNPNDEYTNINILDIDL